MPTVDLIVGAFILVVVAWGIRAGLAGTLAVAGFAVGAVAGALLTPLLLRDGQENDFALVAALPAALLLGGLVATVVERRTTRLRRSLGRRGAANTIGGALLAGAVAVVAAWLVGAALVQVSSLREPVEDSTIVGGLNGVISRPGPSTGPEGPPVDAFPIIVVEGGGPRIAAVDRSLVTDSDVLRADRSVVKIDVVTSCGSGAGSGWIARDGIVATNAHVAAAANLLGVRVGGRGTSHPAQAIWFDPVNDVALLRVPGLRGVRPLPIVRRPRAGTAAVALGFPAGRHAIRAARIGPTTARLQGRMQDDRLGDEFPRQLNGRLVTTFRGRPQGGSSGGPIVDARGRVLAMVFGGSGMALYAGLAVPTRYVLSALRRAGPPVDTGTCPSRGR